MSSAKPKIVALQPKIAPPPLDVVPPSTTPMAPAPSAAALPAPKPAWLRHGSRIVAVIVVALLLLAWALRNVVLGTPVTTFPVHTGNLIQTVVASGRVIAPERVAIASQVVGRVARVAVAEGSEVVAGQLLIELESLDASAARASAEAMLAMAVAQRHALSEVELPAAARSLDEARANLTQMSKQFDRLVGLKAGGFIGQADLDKARRDRDVAQSHVRSAQLQVAARQSGGSSTAMAQATLEQARAALDQATAKLAQFQIHAPASGVLVSRSVESGDIAQPGQELMALASSGKTQIEVQLDEKNLAKLKIGQSALASADAYANQRFETTVAYINPGIDATRGAVMVRLDVLAAPDYLRQDMTVSVDIATASRTSTLIIPTGTIHDLSSKAPWVLVVRARRAVRQDITLGLLGDNNAEVLSGLEEGEQLIPASAAVVQPGAHVRAQPQALPSK